jgi:hypothetical protein
MFENFFCKNLGTENKYFLFYSHSRYLSWGNGFTRIFEIINENCQYLSDKTNYSAHMYIHDDLYNQSVNLNDAFGHLNAPNTSLQV